MGESSPSTRTGWLWVVLAILLTFGTVAAAFFVYGVVGVFSGGPWIVDVPLAVAGAVIASIFLLLTTGMLYRVDRIRGVPHKEVALFE